jgi:uncharacterized low-complexity protein
MRYSAAALLAAALVATGSLASSAYAKSTDNPQWAVCEKATKAKTGGFLNSKCTEESAKKQGEWESKVLIGGEKRTPKVKVAANYKVQFGTAVVICKTIGYTGTFILGSNAPEPGRIEGAIELGQCEESERPECTINGIVGGKAIITSEAFLGKLVFTVKSAAEEERSEQTSLSTADLLVQAFTGRKLFEITFGNACREKGTFVIEGEMLEHFLNSPEKEHTESHTLSALGGGTYWVNEVGKSVEKTATLSASGKVVKISGEVALEFSPSVSWWLFN